MNNVIVYILIMQLFNSCLGEEKNGNDRFVKTTYYDSGNIESYAEYMSSKDTLINGIVMFFYENGNTRLEGICEQGKQEGLFIEYFENHNIKSELNYQRGELNGSAIWYHDNLIISDENKDDIDREIRGSVADSCYYVNDKERGSRFLYYENGKLKMYLFYDEAGRMSYKRTYALDGNVTKELGNYFGNILVDKDRFTVGDTFYTDLYIAIPPDLDYKLFYFEDGNMSVEKKQIYLDDNIYRFKREIEDSNTINSNFELIVDDNRKNGTVENLIISITPDGMTPLGINHEKR